MKPEEKYKDFLELQDTDEITLRHLFTKRCYLRRLKSPLANDILIGSGDIKFTGSVLKTDKLGNKYYENPDIDFTGDTLYNPNAKPSTLKERESYENHISGYIFPPDTSTECATHEIESLKASDIDEPYIRKRVKAYLEICQKIIKENKLPEKEVKFIIEGINISKLIEELQRLKFFDKSYHNSVLNWFKGIPPESLIHIDKSANLFISLIADLKDRKFIKNSKEFCYSYVVNSFLFKGEKIKISYIKKVMKPSSENRVGSKDKTIPDIQLFSTYI